MEFSHPLGAANPVLGRLLNRRLRCGGAQETVCQVAYDPNDPYRAVWAPSWRMVADPADPAGLALAGIHRAVRAPGQHPLRRPAADDGCDGRDAADGGRGALADAHPGAGMSRRGQITLDRAELLALLDSERVVVVSSIGPRGWPHSMPLWYVPRDGEIWIWTYAKSQKVRNLERDPRATLLIETGHEYGELRGAMIEAEADDPSRPRDGRRLRRGADRALQRGHLLGGGDAKAALEAQAPKRVAIQFRALRTASWDHSKLGGSY